MNSLQVKLPRMTNKQYDYVEEEAARRNISFKICPTCHSKQVELVSKNETGEIIHSGLFDWPSDSTYKFLGEEYLCDCRGQIALSRHYILSGIPILYWRLGDGDYWGDLNALNLVKEYLDKWDQHKLYGFGLNIYSPRMGVGKTLLATMIARQLVQRGERVVFVTFQEAIGIFKLSEEKREQQIDRLRNTPVLIVDEIGKGFTDAQHSYMAAELEDLLRFRTSGNSITIITTNLTLEELEEQYPRSFSLLSAKQILIEVQGEDARVNGDKRMIDEELSRNGEVRPIC